MGDQFISFFPTPDSKGLLEYWWQWRAEEAARGGAVDESET